MMILISKKKQNMNKKNLNPKNQMMINTTMMGLIGSSIYRF